MAKATTDYAVSKFFGDPELMSESYQDFMRRRLDERARAVSEQLYADSTAFATDPEPFILEDEEIVALFYLLNAMSLGDYDRLGVSRKATETLVKLYHSISDELEEDYDA